jgi:hypothetical protein
LRTLDLACSQAEDAVFAPLIAGCSQEQRRSRRSDPPSPDAGREERRRRVEITRQPYGEHLYISGREVYAYTLPIVDSKHRMVAIIDLVRDKSALEQEMLRATRDVVLTLGGLAAAAGAPGGIDGAAGSLWSTAAPGRRHRRGHARRLHRRHLA